VWLLVGLVAAAGIVLGIDRAFFSGQAQYSWPPEPCVVQGIKARCGTFVVPENRTQSNGRTIGLRVVVVPALLKPARKDAVAYLAGGPGSAATEEAIDQGWDSSALSLDHDLLLVDQRGTGGSNPGGSDVTQYGTRMAMDDLDAVRAALGYRQLNVIGSSYGATAAQVYLKLHPTLVRTLILMGGTAIDVPIFSRWAVNAQRSLDQLASLCDSDPACRNAFPDWERQFGELVKAWNAQPVNGRTGDELASIVHVMLLDLEKAVSIPLVVSRAAEGDYGPLERAGSGDLDVTLGLMSSIWCNEPWAGLDATGPWGTDFDSYTTAKIAASRNQCGSVPKRSEPRSLWTLPTTSSVPVLGLVGGADPQNPLTNLSDLKRHFRDSRTIVFPHLGHSWSGVGSCVNQVVTDFVDRGTAKGLDTTACVGAVVVPPFNLAGRPQR
jgi:pimeloyl-ACP methyl ester carboxylesterase